jgi:two-component system chemotaxis response regulator CheY
MMDGYGKRVLVVDDDENTRSLIGILLEHAGYNVVQVCDGLDALEEIRKRHFDVVVTDWVMPMLNGLELIQRIQEMSPQMPVILVSGSLPERRKADNTSHWFTCLRKPFDNYEFLDLVRSAAQVSVGGVPSAISST